MSPLFKVIVLFFSLQQCDVAISRRIIKKIWIHKELEHGALHHFEPISFLKEVIIPFGKVSIEHSIEKRDLHERREREHKAKGSDDVIQLPDAEIEKESEDQIEFKKKVVSKNNLLTDIILTRVEFHKGKPIDAIKLHSVLFPENAYEVDETKKDEILSQPLSETDSDLDAQASSKEIIFEASPIPLAIPEEKKSLDNDDESLHSLKSEKIIESKPDVELISDVPKENLKTEEIQPPHEDIHEAEVDGLSKLELSEATDEKIFNEVPPPSIETSELGTIENRESEGKDDVSQAIHENVEIISPSKADDSSLKSIVEVTPKPIESSLTVRILPEPVYIPLYTEIKTPVPIPVEPPVVSEVVNAGPPVAVVTEKEVVVAPPPPPPPVQTETTVIETEQSPGLFSRGSRFMLNISSRILKKLLRLVSRVESRLPASPAVEA